MIDSDTQEVIRVLREIALLLQLDGENAFKTRAYENAADTLQTLKEPLRALVDGERLEELPGFGKAIVSKVTELVRTGSLAYHQKLLEAYPASVLELVKIPGVGPKRAARLWRELQIADAQALARACAEHRVQELPGFGVKTELAILEGLQQLSGRSERVPLARARPIAEAVLAHVLRAPGVIRAEVAGSARRFAETVGDLDLLASIAPGGDAHAVMQYFIDFPGVHQVLGSGETKTSVVLDDGLQLDLRVVPDPDYATALHHFTGSRAHHVKLRGLARDAHLTLSEWGVFKLKKDGTAGEKLAISTEEALYEALGMSYVPPELREDLGEIEAARAGKLPELVTLGDLRGATHAHTTYSDGQGSLEEMALAARAMGLEYLTITDHSQAAGYAHGLDVDRLKLQWDEIDRVNDEVRGLRLLKGAEVDILQDGSLDFPDAILAQLEVVIASIHTRFKMDADQMTARISRAFDNPHLHIWGHATGRLIGEREPYGLHMERLLDEAAEKGVAVEINGSPARLDLSAPHARLALERGVELVLSTDAHSPRALDNLRFAVATARKAWVQKKDVLTHLTAGAFVKHLHQMRR